MGRVHPDRGRKVETAAGKVDVPLPRKRFYRQRAHANPLSIHSSLAYPSSPSAMNWSTLFPAYFSADGSSILPPAESSSAITRPRKVEFADIGCGFGGLLVSLAPLFPENLLLGLEIRTQVTQYVTDKIRALRLAPSSVDPDNENDVQRTLDLKEAPEWYAYDNVGVMRGNAMKFLGNFFEKAQLSKIFFLFPDPHFKQRKHKARIISPTLLAEYAFVLRPGGYLYTITDVPDLHTWMVSHLAAFPLFQRLTEEEIESGLAGLGSSEGTKPEEYEREREKKLMEAVKRRTEEGRKVERNKVGKQWSVWRRIEDPEL